LSPATPDLAITAVIAGRREKPLSALHGSATLRPVRVISALLVGLAMDKAGPFDGRSFWVLTMLAALPLALGACGRTTAPSPSNRIAASATRPATSSLNTPVASPPAPPPATAGAAPATTPVMAELVIPASQIHQPSGLVAGERRPLLIFLHSLGGSGKLAFDMLRLAAFGARERVFVLAPDGSVDRQKRQFWNAGTACCNFDRQEVDDVARLGRLIDVWRARPDVDSTRIYVMGHSNGGFMTERLACALGDRIAAAASMAGAAPPAELACTKTKSLALLEVHGDKDAIVRYEGGSVFDSPALSRFPGSEQGFREWGKRLGCTGTALPAPDRDLDSRLPGSETSVQRYSSCRFGSVELWTVRGGDHYVGTRQQAFEAIWQFLSTHHS
jgi:polyhydroxybutyrate depolymerase